MKTFHSLYLHKHRLIDCRVKKQKQKYINAFQIYSWDLGKYTLCAKNKVIKEKYKYA